MSPWVSSKRYQLKYNYWTSKEKHGPIEPMIIFIIKFIIKTSCFVELYLKCEVKSLPFHKALLGISSVRITGFHKCGGQNYLNSEQN